MASTRLRKIWTFRRPHGRHLRPSRCRRDGVASWRDPTGVRIVRARAAMTIENEEALYHEVTSIFRSALKNSEDPTHSTFWKKQLQPLVELYCDGLEAKVNEFQTEKIHIRIANFVEVYAAKWFCVEIEVR
jgi:hypothetical protein